MAYNVGTASIHIKPDLENFRRDLKKQWETMRKEAADTGEWDMTPGLDTSHLDKAMSDWRDGAAKDFSKGFQVEGLVDVSLDPASMKKAESQASKIAAKVHKKISTGDLVDTDALNHTITVDGIAALNKGFSVAKTNLQGVVDLENARADALERAASAAEAVDKAEASQRSNAAAATETLRMMDRHARKLQQAQAREASTRSDLTTFNLGAADAAYRMHKKGDKSGLIELARQREALKEANATASRTVASMSRIIANENARLTSLQKIGAQLAKNAAASRSAWEIAEASSVGRDQQAFAHRQGVRDHVKTITSGYRQFDSGIDVKKINELLTRELTRNPNEGAGVPYRSRAYTTPENSFDAAHRANPGALPVKLVDFNSSYSPDTENSSGILGAIQSELVSARRIVTETSKRLRSNMVAAADAWDDVEAIQRIRDGWRDEFEKHRHAEGYGYIPDSTRELAEIDKRDRAGFDLYEKLSKTNKYQQYGSDAWKMYYETLPKQAENNRIERENILERDRIAKLESDRLWKTAHTARDYMFAAGNRVDAAAEKARAAVEEIHKSQRELSEAKRTVHEGEVMEREASWRRDKYGLDAAYAKMDEQKRARQWQAQSAPFIPNSNVRAKVPAAKAKVEAPDVDTSGLKDLQVELGTVGRMALRASLQGAGLGIIGLAASGAVPGVAALSSAIGNVGKLAGLLPAMIGAGAVAVGVFALATNGVVESISGLSDTLGEDGLPNMDDYAEATKDMSEQMKSLADSIYLVGDGATESLSQGFDKLRDSVQDKFIDHVANGMDTIQQRLMSMGGIDDLSDSLTKLGGDFGRITQNWANFRFSDSGWADMNTQLGNFEALSESIVSTIGKWQYAWNDLSTVGSTFLPELGRGLDNVTGKFSDFIANARDNGDMAQWFRKGIDSAEQLGSMIGSSFGIVRNVFKATSGDLDDLNDKMEAGLKSAEDYTSSLAGKSALKDFFSDTSAMGSEMVKTLAAFGQSIAEHVVPVLSEFTQGLGPELREAIGTSGGLMDAIAPSARTLGQAVGEMATGFMKFGTWIEPFVSSTLPMLASGFEAIAPAVGAIMGPLAHLIAMRGVISMFEKLGEYLSVVAMTAGGKTLSRLAALVGVGLALSNAFSPVGDVLKWVVDGLESLNDVLGGMPAKVLTLVAALKAIQNAGGVGALSSKVAGFAGFGQGLAQVEKNATGAAKSVTLLGTNMKTGQKTANLYAQSLKQTFARAKADSLAASGAIAGQAGAWKTLKANAAGSMANIKNVMSPMQGAVSGMGKSLAGLGSGLMGAFGGPWGLAVVAGTGAVLSGIEANKGYKRSLEQIADQAKITSRAQRDVADSMLGGSTAKEAYGSVFSEFDEKTAAIAEDDNNAWGDVSAWLHNKGIADGLVGDGQEAADKGKAAADAQKYQKALEDLGYTAEDTGEAAAKSDSQWKAYREELENNGAPEAYMKKLDALRDKARAGEADFQKLSEETKSASRTFAELAESGGASSGDLNKLRGALSGLRGTSSEAATATSQLTRVLDSAAQSAGAVAGATLDAAGNIDTTTTAGASLYDALSQVGDAMGTAVENGNSASSVWDQAQGSLEALRQSAGMGETEWKNLLDRMNMTPERIETLMVVKTNTALTELEGVNQAIKKAQEQGLSEVQFNLSDEEAKKATEQFGIKLNKITEGVYSAKLDADTTEAGSKIDHSMAQLRLFAEMKPKPFADIDTSTFSQKTLDALKEAHVLGSATPKALADLDISQLNQNQRLALASLIDLTNMKAWPSADLQDNATPSVDELKRKLSEIPDADIRVGVDGAVSAQDALRAIDEAVTTLPDGSIQVDSSSPQWALDILQQLGMIDIDKDGTVTVFDDGGSTMLGILSQIDSSVHDRHQTITTEHVEIHTLIQNAQQGVNNTSDPGTRAEKQYYLDQLKADGGVLEGYAIGGRLPTSGPGTNVTDGIYGVDASGRAFARVDAGEWVINADSSRKYDSLLRAINEDRLPGFAGGGVAPGKGRKKDNASIWQDVVTGIATGARNGATNSVNNHVSGTLNGIGTIADGVGLAGVAAGNVDFSEIPKAWDATQSQLEGSWAKFQTDASGIWGSVQAIIDNTFKGIDTAVKTDWGSTQSWTLAQFAALRASTQTEFGNMGNIMSSTFQSVASRFQDTYNSGMVPVFNALQGSVNQSVIGFQNGATGIGNAWSAVREATAAPVRYAVGTVFNGGLVGMWNSTNELLGTPAMAPYPLAFATGGHVQGPGTATSDSIPAMLSDGEYVINAAATQKIGLDNLNALNSGNVAFAANAFRDKTFEDVAIRRASGGPVKGTTAWNQLKRGYDWARSRNGRPYVWGGSANGSGGADCSGFMSGIADVILGGDGTRQWATMSFPGGQQGAWGPGLGAGFAVGISDVHTAGTIGGVEGMPAVNVESGGSNGGMSFGGPNAVGADDGQFNRQFHMLVGGGGAFKPGMGRAGGASIASLVAEAISPWQEKIKAALGGYAGEGLIGNLPRAAGEKLNAAMEEKINSAAAEMQSMAGAAGVDLSGISGDTVNKVREVFARHGWTGQQWDDAQWIIGKESGWNLSATNPSSGAFGLFQFNPSSGTLQQYLPDRSTDAAVQGDAGARYIKDRYGNPTAARGFWEQNGWYDNGGWLKPGVTRVTNETGKPEPVFNPGQWDIIRNNIAANSAIVEAINSNDSWAASQARVNAQHEETLTARAAKESANNDDDPDNDIEDEEITPVISMKQWDQIAASVNAKVRAGDVDGVRGELSNVFDILSEAAEQVDWVDVMEQPIQDTVDSMIKGQADDALGVFGMSGVDSIPAVAASKKFQEDTQAQREKEADDLKESKKDYTDADENIQSKQESLDSAKEDLAKLQEDLAGLTDADEIADKQDQIKEKQESVAKLEKDLQKAKDDKQKALDSANRLSADAYTGNSDLPLDDYVDPDAAAKKEKKERDKRIAAKKEAERLEKKIQKKAVGGWITGPGGPTADIIPLLASAGEFMVRASSASNAPHLLNAINSDPGTASNLNDAFTGKIGNESVGNSGDTYEFHIHANSVDEGMRRADAYKRQQVAAHNPRR